jgi:hypothetical protein
MNFQQICCAFGELNCLSLIKTAYTMAPKMYIPDPIINIVLQAEKVMLLRVIAPTATN